MKIAFIIGTRPEIIKMAPLLDEVEKRDIEHILIHTGQHYDQEMSEQFFDDLELSQPDYNIGVGSGSHGKQTAFMMEEIEKILVDETPDIVLVEGDTNAVLAGAITASKLHLPLGHVEAGLRSYDKTMPEEINRVVADVCTKLFFVPTEESALNLVFEGLNTHDIFITGNTIVDACLRNLKIAEKSSQIKSTNLEREVLILTLHRAENVDNATRLRNIAEAILDLDELHIIFPVHPRTVKNLKKFGLYQVLEEAEHIHMIKPVGYLDFLILLSRSKLVMTDSGGIQEEAITLDLPCITLRYNTERPETVTAGGNVLVGTDKEVITETVGKILSDSNVYQKMKEAKNPYGDGKSAEKIINSILKVYDEGKLEIKPPENILGYESYYLQKVDEKITVAEFERKNKYLRIRTVFDKGEALFPHSNLQLKDKNIIINGLNPSK